jgi:hypothetical protein
MERFQADAILMRGAPEQAPARLAFARARGLSFLRGAHCAAGSGRARLSASDRIREREQSMSEHASTVRLGALILSWLALATTAAAGPKQKPERPWWQCQQRNMMQQDMTVLVAPHALRVDNPAAGVICIARVHDRRAISINTGSRVYADTPLNQFRPFQPLGQIASITAGLQFSAPRPGSPGVIAGVRAIPFVVEGRVSPAVAAGLRAMGQSPPTLHYEHWVAEDIFLPEPGAAASVLPVPAEGLGAHRRLVLRSTLAAGDGNVLAPLDTVACRTVDPTPGAFDPPRGYRLVKDHMEVLAGEGDASTTMEDLLRGVPGGGGAKRPR